MIWEVEGFFCVVNEGGCFGGCVLGMVEVGVRV